MITDWCNDCGKRYAEATSGLCWWCRTGTPDPDHSLEELAPGLNWQTQREAWNRDRQCARQACLGPLDRYAARHKATGLLYCLACTRLLQRHQSDDALQVVHDPRLDLILPLFAAVPLCEGIHNECEFVDGACTHCGQPSDDGDRDAGPPEHPA